MDSATLTRQLVSLGLNEREAKLYYSLLQVDEAAPSDLHRMSGVPRTKVYETLERLTSAGYCFERIEGRKRYYRAVPPKEVHEELQRRWDAERQGRTDLARKVFDQLHQLTEHYQYHRKGIDFIEVIRNKAQISHRYVTMVSETKSEIHAFVRPPFASVDPDEADKQNAAELASIERGVHHHSIYMVDPEWWDFMERDLHELGSRGEEARLIDELPLKMFVFDRSKTLIALPSIPGASGTDFSMIAVQDPAFANAFVILFDVFWEKAKTPQQWFDEHRD